MVDIVAEPNLLSSSLLVHGRSRSGASVLLHFDFEGVHERDCTGIDAPDTPASDYESWIPNNGW